MPETEAKDEKLTPKQKLSLGILCFLGVGALIFGLLQFLYNIKAPFAGRGTGLKNFKTVEQQEMENLLALQSKDTDQDGLSDFDETYLYKTSPYLEDSDSDGFLDKQEIDSGNDPNCPAGKDCMRTEGVPSGTGSISPLVNSPLANIDLGIFRGETNPEAVRNLLRQSGVSDEILSKIDDKTLMEIYQETLKETPLPPELNATLNTNTNVNTNQMNLSNLSPDQIRALLRQAGVEEELLQSLDDETLRKIFEESIK